MNFNDYYLIGSIIKTHGNSGELILKFDNNLFFETKKELVFIDIDGELVPFFINEYIQKTGTTAIVKFDYIEELSKAKKFVECNIYLPKKYIVASSKNVDKFNLIGFSVIDKQLGEVGKINNIIEIKSNPLLTILSSKGDEILMPFNEDFIEDVDYENGLIKIDMPDGLIDLYSDVEKL